jgi:hypothetical protein
MPTSIAAAQIRTQVLNEQHTESNQITLTLDDVVQTALTKNPAVQSASHAVAAERAKVPQASALPDLTFGLAGWAIPGHSAYRPEIRRATAA